MNNLHMPENEVYYSDIHHGWMYYNAFDESCGPYPTMAAAVAALYRDMRAFDNNQTFADLFREFGKWVKSWLVNSKNAVNKS